MDDLTPQTQCSICTMMPTADDEWISGYIGVLAVTLCDVCAAGVAEMLAYFAGDTEE
jgi:hypothetical protein